jgi:tripartite ATP-independent transporter DctP family solute receptor
MTRRPSLLAVVLAALVATILPAAAEEAPPPVKQIFLAHTQPQNAASDPIAAMAVEFQHQVKERTQGRVTVGIFPAGQLGGNRDMVRLVSRNVVQSSFVTVGGIAPLCPSIAVIEMPFALPSEEVAYRVFDGPFGQKLAGVIEQKTGLAVLGFGDGGGFFAITNSRRPIHAPSDMQGLKIRTVPGFEPLEAMISSLGAKPVAVSSREEATALASGVVDGQMSPPVAVLANRFDDVQKYITLTDHLYTPTVWIFNRDALNGLSAEDQTAVRQAATAALAVGRRVAHDVAEKQLPVLRRRMEVIEPTPSELAAFKAATQPAVAAVVAKSLGEEGTQLLAAFLAAAKAPATPSNAASPSPR